MNKLSLLIVPALLVVGCKSTTTSVPANPDAIPADAKFTQAKEPAINAETRYAAGLLAETSNQPESAIEQYHEALKLEPEHAPTLYRLGVLQSQRKNFPAAIDAWTRYLKATNNSAMGYGNLGFCQELAGNLEAAEAAYKKGIGREPKNQLCRVNYGLMLARTGRINDALVQLQAVLTPAAARYNLGSVYEQQGKTAQAKLEYTRALEIDPTFVEASQRLTAMSE